MRGHVNAGPDRKRPEWAKPLAPLPEWLDSVESILREHRPPVPAMLPLSDRPQRPLEVARRVDWRVRPARIPDEGRRLERLRDHGVWLRWWRRHLGLTRAQAASALGYGGPKIIARIEAGKPVARPVGRQRRLAVERLGTPDVDRSDWIRKWRQRLGVSHREAIAILGYRGHLRVWEAENGRFQPAWEKVLVAIAEECHR